jgi:hypothetical protein
MPLTDELGEACLNRDAELRDDPRVPKGFRDGNFELWLSEIAADQPYLPAHANRANDALFLRFSQAIADVLGARVDEVLSHPWPTWLPVFLKVAHVTRSTVVTFNYDPLLECAVDTEVLFDPTVGSVTWSEITDFVPPWAGARLEARAEPPPTMSLLKVHGSLNWYWAPGDMSGASVARRVLPGYYGHPEPYEDRERSRELPGRVPLVVPPTATKASYYTNPIVREIWTKAAGALREADRVVLMGYSVPLTDLTFTAMFRHAINAETTSVMLADLEPDDVATRVRSFGCAVDIVSGGSHEGPIAAYVHEWCRKVAGAVADEVRSGTTGQPNAPMVVAWGQHAAAAVTAVASNGMDVVLSVEPVRDGGAVRVRAAGAVLPTLNHALALMSHAGGALVVDVPGDPQPVIQCSLAYTNMGYGAGVWNVLMPAGAMPSPAGAGTPPTSPEEPSYRAFSLE